MEVRPSKFPRKEIGEGRGKYQSEVGEVLQSLHPLHHVLEEFPCVGDGLYLDFFVPQKMLAIEVQGTQHHKFNKFFHADKNAFARQQANDSRKSRWCQLNDIQLVVINWGTPLKEVREMLT
jgi:hypothetical protein